MIVPLLKADVTNLNGRIYTEEEILYVIAQFQEEQYSGIPVLGEVGDYDTILGNNSRFTSLVNVTHIITDMYLGDEGVLYGRVEFLSDHQDMEAMLKSGFLVIRPRSIAESNEGSEVVIDQVVSWDIIPRTNDAFMEHLPAEVYD